MFISIPYQQPITLVTEILTYPRSSFIGEVIWQIRKSYIF